jgi:L-malate glycosyltransferase
VLNQNKRIVVAYLMHGARNVGGGEYSLFFLIKNLKKDIFRPVVFYAQENEIICNLQKENITTIKIPLHKNIISVYRDEIRYNPLSLSLYIFYMVQAIFRVKAQLRRNNVVLLHPHDNLSKIIGSIAAKMSGVKLIAHCRDLLQKKLMERMLLFYQLLMMNKIITVSEGNRKLFKIGRKISRKVTTIYNGIDLDVFDSLQKKTFNENVAIRQEDVVIGIIGVFDTCKGHIFLFKAIDKLVAEGDKNITCLVVGDGRNRARLETFIAQRSLQDYIKILGYRKDVPLLLKYMDIVVLPSLQESFPRVLLEAMAAKTPVIATRVGGIPEAVQDGKTGILVLPGDSDMLLSALKYLIKNPSIRKQMGEEGRKRVEERFCIEKNVGETEKLYLEMLKE